MRRWLGIALAAIVAVVALGWWLVPARQSAQPQIAALTSASITLPADDEALPAGPHVDVVTANCTSCHSAAMIVSQPPLSPEQWQATVTKMREVYRAPVAAADEPAILAYLSAVSASKAKEPS